MEITKDEILARIQDKYDELLQAIQSNRTAAIGSDEMDREGGWTAKDILAHVSAWEKVLLEFHIGGQPFEEVIAMPGARYLETSFDAINDHLYTIYKGWSWDAVEQFAVNVHHALMKKLESISADDYRKPGKAIAAVGLDPYPLHEYVAANTYDHYAEHLENLVQASK
jgi:hypothetical protein